MYWSGRAFHKRGATMKWAELTVEFKKESPLLLLKHGQADNSEEPFSGIYDKGEKLHLDGDQIIPDHYLSHHPYAKLDRCASLTTGRVRQVCRWPFFCLHDLKSNCEGKGITHGLGKPHGSPTSNQLDSSACNPNFDWVGLAEMALWAHGKTWWA